MIWIEPNKIMESWRPEIYSEEFSVLSEWLATRDDAFITVSKYFSVVSRSKHTINSSTDIRWKIVLERNSISLIYQPDAVEEINYVVIPDEAIIFGQFIDGEIPVFYWNSRIAGGNAILGNNLIAIEPIQKNSLAWVTSALRSDISQQQLKRSAIGSVINRVQASSIMSLEIPDISSISKFDNSTMARNDLVLNVNKARSIVALSKAKRNVKQLLLTGATFEERMTQFEEYLIQQRLFDERKSFFAEKVINDNNTVNYMIRPLRSSWDSSDHTDFKKPITDEVRSYLKDIDDVIVQYDARSDKEWNSWLDDQNGQQYKIYNVGSDTYGITDQITTSILRQLYAIRLATTNDHCTFKSFPAYTSFLDLLQIDKADTFDDIVNDNNINAYTAALITNETAKQTLYDLYSPALAIKVIRDNVLVGVYIFITDYEHENQQEIESVLNGYGIELSNLITQLSEFVSDAARRESLRRLSDVMHRLNGPVGRAVSALTDIENYLSQRDDIAKTLLPDEQKARNRARMKNEPLDNHTLSGRLRIITSAVKEIRDVSYKFKRLYLAQSSTSKIKTCLSDIIERSILNLNDSLPELSIENATRDKYYILADEVLISGAIDEVMNNAIREFKENNVDNPHITVAIEKNKGFYKIKISDNAMPGTKELINNPFEESASTYLRSGRGTGLGLAIVRETFLAHGGECKLYANFDMNGLRIPGVTFEATLLEYIE